jgi:hypothetical protein
MRRVEEGHAARWQYFRVIYGLYGNAKGVMLDEFCLNTDYQRKYAIRLLNGLAPGKREEDRSQGREPQYRPGSLILLAAVWEKAGSSGPGGLKQSCRHGDLGFANGASGKRRRRSNC